MVFNEYSDPISPDFLRYDGLFLDIALKRFDPDLLPLKPKKKRLFSFTRKKYHVWEGQIGLASKKVGSHLKLSRFFMPGNYLRIGMGWTWEGTCLSPDKGGKVVHNDITIFEVPPNMVTVIRVGGHQHRLRTGKYIIRSPIMIEREYSDHDIGGTTNNSSFNPRDGRSTVSVARPNINASVDFIVQHLAEFEQKDPSDKCYAQLRKSGLFDALEYLRDIEHYDLIEKWSAEGFYWPLPLTSQ